MNFTNMVYQNILEECRRNLKVSSGADPTIAFFASTHYIDKLKEQSLSVFIVKSFYNKVQTTSIITAWPPKHILMNHNYCFLN